MSARILLIEDDRDHATLVRRQLRRLAPAPEVTWAESVDDARAKLAGEAFDLLVVDLRVRGQDGLLVLASEGAGSPRAVILSSSDHPEDRARAEAAGAIDYLVKPAGGAGYAEVAATIARYLQPASSP